MSLRRYAVDEPPAIGLTTASSRTWQKASSGTSSSMGSREDKNSFREWRAMLPNCSETSWAVQQRKQKEESVESKFMIASLNFCSR